jgi:NACHT domain- and WD repeat-containing protein
MAQNTHTFRVFVSSTFSDMKAERNALQAHVFPRLRELCEQHGSRFQPIDLRWGVSTEASLDQQAMNICLGEIKRCRQISRDPTSSSCWETAMAGCHHQRK